MKEISKISALAVGIVLCGVGMSSDASAAGYYLTPEQDAKIQQEGIEFNRRYDIEHGYYNAKAVPAPVRYNQPVRQVQVAPVRHAQSAPAQQVQTVPARRPRPVQANKHAHQIYQQQAPARQSAVQFENSKQNVQNRQAAVAPVQKNWQSPSGRIAQAQQQEMARQEAARKQALARRQARQQAVSQQRNISVGQQRTLVNPSWATNVEKDNRMQQAALDYNRQYDLRYVK